MAFAPWRGMNTHTPTLTEAFADSPDEDLALRPVLDRARLLRLALGAQFAMIAVHAATTRWATAAAAEAWSAGGARALGDIESRYTAVNTLSGAVSLVVGLLFVSWLRSLYEAAPSLQVGGLRRGPGAAWTYFVPFANLWIPFQMLSQFHAAADPACVASRLPPPPRTDAPVGAWWVTWVASGAPLLLRLVFGEAHRSVVPRDATWHLAAFALLGVATVIGMRVVARMSARVTERARRVAAPRELLDLR